MAQASVTYGVSAEFDEHTWLTGEFTTNVYGYLAGIDLTTASGTIPAQVYMLTTIYPGGGCIGPCFELARNSPPYPGALQLTFAQPLGLLGSSVRSDTPFGATGVETRSPGDMKEVRRFVVPITGALLQLKRHADGNASRRRSRQYV